MRRAAERERGLQELQAQIKVLEGRVAALEHSVGVPPVQSCRLCGERAAHRTHVHSGDAGHVVEWWDCAICHERDLRIIEQSPLQVET